MNGEANAPARFFHSHNLNSFAMNTEEIWKDIKGYEGIYRASTLGGIESLKFGKIRKLKKHINSDGYFVIGVHRKGVATTRIVHQLIAETFLNHIPCGILLVVNHINFNKLDNRVENLEIVTNRYNTNRKHIPHSSIYTGVSWQKKTSKWQAYIRINGKKKHLGLFKDEYNASLAYEKELSKIISN